MMTTIRSVELHIEMARRCIGPEALARMAGISRQTLRRALRDGRPVRLETVGRIAQALGVDVTEIANIE